MEATTNKKTNMQICYWGMDQSKAPTSAKKTSSLQRANDQN